MEETLQKMNTKEVKQAFKKVEIYQRLWFYLYLSLCTVINVLDQVFLIRDENIPNDYLNILVSLIFIVILSFGFYRL